MPPKTEKANVDVNINGEKANNTLKSMRGELRALNAELDKLPIGSEEYAKAMDKLKEKRQIYGDLTKEIKNTSSAMDEMKKKFDDSWFGKIRNGFLAISGIIAGAAGAFKIFKDALSTTDALADKWEETMTAAKEGYNALLRSIITGDWSNLIKNMTTAIRVGKEYAATLDEIHERQLGLNIAQAEARMKINDLILIMKDQRKTDAERAAAASQALKIENDLLTQKFNLARTNFNNELNQAASQTGLNQASIAQYLKLRDQNNEKIKSAQEYLDLLKEQYELSEKIQKVRGGAADPFDLQRLDAINKQLQGISTSTKVYATEVVEKMGKIQSDQMEKVANSYAAMYSTQNDFKEGTRRLWSQYTGFLKEESNTQEKDFETLQKAKLKKAQELWNALVKQSEDLGKLYLEALGEEEKIEERKQEMILKYGAGTADELLRIEMDRITQSEEFARLSAEQKAIILKAVYQDALGTISKASPMQSTSAYSEGGDTFSPEFDSSSTGTPDIIPGLPVNNDVIAGKIAMVADYANGLKSILTDLDAFIRDMESAQLARDEDINNRKKENLKRQLDSKKITQKQYDDAVTKMDTELDAKKRKLEHDQAVRQKALALMGAIINTAEAAAKALTAGPLIGQILYALTAALGAVQIGIIAGQPVPQAAKGKYSVIGQSDGRSYEAEWGGRSSTGIYARPTLIAEAGPEMVVDAPTTRNIQINYPWLMNAIMAARVPQFASGNYPDSIGGMPLNDNTINVELLGAIQAFNAHARNGIRTFLVYDDIRNTEDTVTEIESNVAN